MPKKRRNNGKNRQGRGHVDNVRCSNCFRCVPKDKAIKRFNIRSLVEAAAVGDIAVSSVYKQGQYTIPKVYVKNHFCVSCAQHSRQVSCRSPVNRRIRAPPMRQRIGQKIKPSGKPQRGVKASARRLAIVAAYAAQKPRVREPIAAVARQ